MMTTPDGDSLVYVVIIEDRHIDVNVEVWSNKDKALQRANEVVQDYARHPEDIEPMSLNSEMIRDGWIFNQTYSCEGDSIRVVERVLFQ